MEEERFEKEQADLKVKCEEQGDIWLTPEEVKDSKLADMLDEEASHGYCMTVTPLLMKRMNLQAD